MLEKINSPIDLKKIPKKELPELCAEIREKIIDVMSKNGGHLASNLGVVELTAILHYVFNSPEDLIIFDVGHQCYTHKLLTGRNKDFDLIRKKNGPSGFLRRKESPYDPVDSGHSSTSISSAIGFAVANQHLNKNNHIIVIIGDGALTGGIAFEGLNFSGNYKLPLVVILNDNEMSISKNVGALSKVLNKIAVSNFYQRTTDFLDKILRKGAAPLRWILRVINYIKRSMKFVVGYENIFTNLGFEYIGPINGHDINELIYLFERVKKNIRHPVLLHLKTVKGKGFPLAENNPSAFHGVTPYLMESGEDEITEFKTFTDVFSETIVELGREFKDIVAVTAAMETGTGLWRFHKVFPDRFYDVGIAEQHAATFCGALANGGLRPVLAVYSTFLLRALDQLSLDICLSKAPVIMAIDRAGIVGSDGETHQGQFDISYLKMLPDLTIMAPCDASELKLMLKYSYFLNSPAAIRYPRDFADESQLENVHPDIETNPFILLKKGSDVLIIVIGPFVGLCNDVINECDLSNLSVGLLYLRILKPLNEAEISKVLSEYKSVIVIEENVYSGSVSQDIASIILKLNKNILFSSINITDKYIEHDSRKNLLNELGYNKNNIKKVINDLVKNISLNPIN